MRPMFKTLVDGLNVESSEQLAACDYKGVCMNYLLIKCRTPLYNYHTFSGGLHVEINDEYVQVRDCNRRLGWVSLSL